MITFPVKQIDAMHPAPGTRVRRMILVGIGGWFGMVPEGLAARWTLDLPAEPALSRRLGLDAARRDN